MLEWAEQPQTTCSIFVWGMFESVQVFFNTNQL